LLFWNWNLKFAPSASQSLVLSQHLSVIARQKIWAKFKAVSAPPTTDRTKTHAPCDRSFAYPQLMSREIHSSDILRISSVGPPQHFLRSKKKRMKITWSLSGGSGCPLLGLFRTRTSENVPPSETIFADHENKQKVFRTGSAVFFHIIFAIWNQGYTFPMPSLSPHVQKETRPRPRDTQWFPYSGSPNHCWAPHFS